MNFLTIPHDKALHAIYGALVALLALLVWPLTGVPLAPREAGLAAAALFGVGKELLDIAVNMRAGRRVHEPSFADAAVTFAGGVAIWAAAGGLFALHAALGWAPTA